MAATQELHALAIKNVATLMEYLGNASSKFKCTQASQLLELIHRFEGPEAVVDLLDRLNTEDFAFTPNESRFLPAVRPWGDAAQHLSRRAVMGFGFIAGFSAGRQIPRAIDAWSSPRNDAPPSNTSQTISGRQILREVGSGLVGGGVGVAAVHAAFLYRDRNAPPTPEELGPIVRALDAHIAQALELSTASRTR